MTIAHEGFMKFNEYTYSPDVEDEVDDFLLTGKIISHHAAYTIASWWADPDEEPWIWFASFADSGIVHTELYDAIEQATRNVESVDVDPLRYPTPSQQKAELIALKAHVDSYFSE